MPRRGFHRLRREFHWRIGKSATQQTRRSALRFFPILQTPTKNLPPSGERGFSFDQPVASILNLQHARDEPTASANTGSTSRGVLDITGPAWLRCTLRVNMHTEKVIMVRPARFVPICLFVTAGVLGIVVSPWWLLSIQFVAIGTLFTAPNLNLINGMPSYLSMIAGFILMRFHEPSGLAVLEGAMASFYACAIEMRIFAKPYVG
jgi:hypothetical protein